MTRIERKDQCMETDSYENGKRNFKDVDKKSGTANV